MNGKSVSNAVQARTCKFSQN